MKIRDEKSVDCANANRGINIQDQVADYQQEDYEAHNPIKNNFGEPDQLVNVDEGELPSWCASTGAWGYQYVYQFQYHGKTYYKIFYVGESHGGASVAGVEYLVES